MIPGQFEKADEFAQRYLEIYQKYADVFAQIKYMDSRIILERIIAWVEEAQSEGHRRLLNPEWHGAKNRLFTVIAEAVIECMPADVRIEGDFLKRNGPGD
jgi:hypothetical protein